MRIGTLAATLLVTPACSDSATPSRPDAATIEPVEPVAPPAPAPDPTFVLGTAGAPRPLFGAETAPTFESAFASLAAAGFNRFLPLFLTSESGAGSSHVLYFLPTDVPGIPPELSCTSAFNPWRALPAGFSITFPAYLPVIDQPTSDPLDATLARARLSALLTKCLDGEATKIGEAYLYDEPATNYIATYVDNQPLFEVANVATLASASRAVLQRPTAVVEAPTPFWLPYIGATPQQIADLVPRFWAQVDQITPHADWYGFDIYPIDMLDDLSVIGEYLGHARMRAPGARSLAVLQAFGAKDMMLESTTPGRRPTREETRAMAFYAVAKGARGVFYYGASALTIGDGPLWDDVREVVGDLRALSGVLVGAPQAVEVGNMNVGAARWPLAAGTWFVIANPTKYKQAIELRFDAATHVFDALHDRLLERSTTMFGRELAAYESLVIVTTPAD